MTTLQEFDEKATSYLDKLTTYVEGRVILEMLKPLIHQAVDEAYLAGKEDRTKEIVEMIEEMVLPTVYPDGIDTNEERRQILSDLKQSIIK